MLDSKIEHWERHGFGMWLLRDRESGEFVGRGGLQWTTVEGEPVIEAGWALIPAWWGAALPRSSPTRRSTPRSARSRSTAWSRSRCRTTSRRAV